MKPLLLFLPSRRCSLESNADDVATALGASEAGDRVDVGRLTSPLFLQEREVRANQFSAPSRSRIEKSRDSGSVQRSQMEREKSLSEQRDLHNFLARRADQAFRGECAAQTRLSEAQSELDRREWKMQSADAALHESSIQLHSWRMVLYQANQFTDHSKREREEWLCTELDRRDRALQEDRKKSFQ